MDAIHGSPNGADGASNGSGGSSIAPPYWPHRRADSFQSTHTVRRALITLEDHTEEPSDRSGGLWAKSVTIDDYVIVSESRSGVGAYVVYNCVVETLDVCSRLCLFNGYRAKAIDAS
jgi:hypothetical protein